MLVSVGMYMRLKLVRSALRELLAYKTLAPGTYLGPKVGDQVDTDAALLWLAGLGLTLLLGLALGWSMAAAND